MKAISILQHSSAELRSAQQQVCYWRPEEGKETRRRLKAQGARIADKVNETLRNKGIKLSREDMEDMVDDIADELKPIDD